MKRLPAADDYSFSFDANNPQLFTLKLGNLQCILVGITREPTEAERKYLALSLYELIKSGL